MEVEKPLQNPNVVRIIYITTIISIVVVEWLAEMQTGVSDGATILLKFTVQWFVFLIHQVKSTKIVVKKCLKNLLKLNLVN
jgi:hypothetical protein